MKKRETSVRDWTQLATECGDFESVGTRVTREDRDRNEDERHTLSEKKRRH